MNILLYVITLLLVLSAMTYAKWSNFESSIGLQKSFMQYVGSVEQNGSYNNAENWYHRIKVRKNKQTEKKESDTIDKNTSIGRLSFHLLLKKSDREKFSNEHQQIRLLTKRLMNVLYGDKSFFIEMATKRPNFLDEILDEIQNASDRFTEKEQIKEVTALSNLEFVDRDLHHTFYLMMKGLPHIKNRETHAIQEGNPVDVDDEEDHAAESKESTSKGGYVSLTDMISVKPVFKIRVFLASKPLLLAIYADPTSAENVIEKREDVYRQLRRFGADGNASSKEYETLKASLAKEFENEASRGMIEEFRPLLDFTVSKTNPNKYE